MYFGTFTSKFSSFILTFSLFILERTYNLYTKILKQKLAIITPAKKYGSIRYVMVVSRYVRYFFIKNNTIVIPTTVSTGLEIIKNPRINPTRNKTPANINL